MVKNYFLLLFVFSLGTISAQVPTEQDCLGAIPVCQETYYQENSYTGTGNYQNEIPTGGGCPGNCLLNGERNDVWYIFTVQAGGDLGFNLTPNNNTDDYDWAVYSLNEYKCQDILQNAAQMQVSCNYSGTSGLTGPNGLSSLNCQNAMGSPHNAMIPVEAGETYVINISNYSSTQFGYLLDFSISTAEIYDDVPPSLDEVETDGLDCGIDQLTFDFSEKVLCSTVQASDFQIEGPGGPFEILSVYGEACDVGGETENTYTITFDPPINQGGDYTLDILPLSFIQDNCGNNAFAQSLEFNLELGSIQVDAGEDQEVPFLNIAYLDGNASGGSGDYTYYWEPADKLEDPSQEDPTTIPLTETTVFSLEVTDNSTSCVNTDQVTVSIVGGEMSVAVTGDPAEICAGESTLLNASPSGGSGEYTYEWSSEPPGFASNIKSPTAFPEATTVYKVLVSDGFSTINGEVSIMVNPKPVSNAGMDQTIAQGTPAQLLGSASGGSPPYNYSWEPASMIEGSNTIADPYTVVLLEPQTYTLLVTDNEACKSDISEVLILTEGEGLSAFPQATPNQVCTGGSATINANASGGSGNYTYSWTSSEPGWSASGIQLEVSPISTTTYFLEVNDGYSTYETHIVVPVLPLPSVDLIPEGYEEISVNTINACVRDTILLDAGDMNNPPEMQYLWSNNWGGQFLVTRTNGIWFEEQTHSVLVTNPVTTCSNSDTITILFNFDACAIGVPESKFEENPFKIHPNPTHGDVTIYTEQAVQVLDVHLFSIHGVQLAEASYRDISAGGWKSIWNLRHLKKGVYLIRIEADESIYTTRMVKH